MDGQSRVFITLVLITGASSATIFSGPIQLPPGKKRRVYDIMGRIVEPITITPGIYFIEIEGQISKKVIRIK